jgi:hypothetical protein
MSETILDFCKVCGTPSAVHVPGGLFCLQKQLAAEKAMRHDAMAAYAKLEADWRAEKSLREAAEARESSFITRAKETATTSCTDGVWWATCKNGGVYGPQATEREVLLEVAEMRHVFAEKRAAGLQQERDFFMQEIYEFGCKAMSDKAIDMRQRSLGFVWQRVCVLKDAIKHGCREGILAPAPEQEGGGDAR